MARRRRGTSRIIACWKAPENQQRPQGNGAGAKKKVKMGIFRVAMGVMVMRVLPSAILSSSFPNWPNRQIVGPTRKTRG